MVDSSVTEAWATGTSKEGLMTPLAKHYARKSQRRITIVDSILDVLSSKQIFDTLDYRHKKEGYLKQYMHQPLVEAVKQLYRDLDKVEKPSLLEKYARASVLWEGDVNTTVNHIRVLGVQHRPDFIVIFDDVRIAVEVKRADSGMSVREGIGQGVVYAASGDYDFVILLLIDLTKGKSIVESLHRDGDQHLVDSLWENYNIRLGIV